MDISIDTEYKSSVITKVTACRDGWVITDLDGWEFFVPKEYGIEPKVDDLVMFYGQGIGYDVRGLVIANQVVFYRTEEQQEVYKLQQLEKSYKKEKEEFEKKKPELDLEYLKLPKEFQERITGFRCRNNDFRCKYESYEMFSCQEAVKIIVALKTLEQIILFIKSDYTKRKEMVPLLNDGHSGNTMGAAGYFARMFVENPKDVPKIHGALCPLVGCKEYGCWVSCEEAYTKNQQRQELTNKKLHMRKLVL